MSANFPTLPAFVLALALTLTLTLTTTAFAQTDPFGIVEISGSVTFVAPAHQGQFANLELGDSLWGTLRVDLSAPPTQGPGNSLAYELTGNTPVVFVGMTSVLMDSAATQPQLGITDGAAPDPDRIDLAYPVRFWGGPSVGQSQGTAHIAFLDAGGDAWSSPLIAGVPAPLMPELDPGQSASLRVVTSSGTLVFEATLQTFYIDLSSESRCNAVLNSTFQTGRLTGIGSRLFVDNSFSILADRLPPDSFGLFLTSATEGFVQNPGGQNGNLCLNGIIGRYLGQVQSSGTAGTMTLDVDLLNLPVLAGTVSISAGETRFFQLWHRDVSTFGTATNNFTQSLGVLFE